MTYEKGSANERREKKVSMTNFHFLSRVQPALIQRQCKREERKESEYDELSFSFPSAACSYPKNQQLVIVLPEGSEELPIRIVRGSRSRREAHAHPSTKLCANGLQAHQLRCPTAATSRPHVGCCLCTRLTTNGAITLPRPTAASWTRSGHRSYPITRSPHNARHRPIRLRRQSVTAAGS